MPHLTSAQQTPATRIALTAPRPDAPGETKTLAPIPPHRERLRGEGTLRTASRLARAGRG